MDAFTNESFLKLVKERWYSEKYIYSKAVTDDLVRALVHHVLNDIAEVVRNISLSMDFHINDPRCVPHPNRADNASVDPGWIDTEDGTIGMRKIQVDDAQLLISKLVALSLFEARLDPRMKDRSSHQWAKLQLGLLGDDLYILDRFD